MNKQPNDFNFDESHNDFKLPQAENTSHRDNEHISTESVIAHKKQLKRLLTILIGMGLILGLVLSVGLVALLNKLGLTKKPYQLKQQKEQPVEQIHDRDRNEFPETESYVINS